MNSKAKGYILGCVAAATYGMNPLFALPLYGAGMDPVSVLFFRYLFAVPIIGGMMLARGRRFKVGGKNLWQLAVMGLMVGLSSLTLFMSYNYMEAGIASTILFVYPVMVAVMMALMFGEKLGWTKAICIAVATAGIVLLCDGSPSGGTASGFPLAGTLLALTSALTYAIYIVAVNKTSLSRVATLTVTFWVLAFGFLLFGVAAATTGHLVTPPADRWWLWGCVVALALFPTAISFLCTTQAIQYIGSTPTAILGALESVTALVFGVLVFGETLTALDGLGIAMVLTAVTLVIAAPSVHTSLNRIRKMLPPRKKC